LRAPTGAPFVWQSRVGGEYRYSPNNISSALAGIQERSKWGIFAALFLNSHFALSSSPALEQLARAGRGRELRFHAEHP
jgi:hypothetical protein